MEPLRIIVADDYSAFRYAISKFFAEFAAFEVVGEAADGPSAIEMSLYLVPHVVIMDVKMPRLDGVEATRRIKRVLPDIHVVGISTQDDTATREAMINAGCSAFVTKEFAHTLPAVVAQLTGRQMANACFES